MTTAGTVRKPRQRRTARPVNKRSKFAQTLWREWKTLNLPVRDASAVVAVSGGADSVALLLALDELIRSKKLEVKLIVAHLDHGLRGDSKADARWVANLALRLNYPFAVGRVDVTRRAAKTGDNLEQAARRARYDFLTRVARKRRADLVLTGHTMDDQAETVLLNLLRGSGADGLGGIEPARSLTGDGQTRVARPLLSWARRRDTENYCRLLGTAFRVDEMNANEKFARVRVRRQLLPLMESFNPRMVEGLVRTAALLRDDAAALDQAAARLVELATENHSVAKDKGKRQPGLRLDLVASAPAALRRRALRHWISQCRGDLRRLERVHVAAVESLLFGERGGRVVELPGGSRISRARGVLRFSE